MNNHLLLILAALFNLLAVADEGMWMPEQLPLIAKDLKKAGLKLDPKTLSKLTDFPMGAVVGLVGCSGSFVSPKGLVVTNHHCVYRSLGFNSTPSKDLITNGFAAKTLAEELPAAPGSRIFVTQDVKDVSKQVITPQVEKLVGKERFDAIEANQKAIISECEKDAGHRCTVPSFYGCLKYYLIKQLEIRDVRLVYAPPAGVGKFGGETDNWMWPRHTGDFGFYRAYVGKDGKAADFAKDNIPYTPKHVLKITTEGIKEGDFVMVLGYPANTNRHRVPSEVEFTFQKGYPLVVKLIGESIDLINKQTQSDPELKVKYASQVASLNNYYKNRKGMVDSYNNSDVLARKTKSYDALKTWIKADPSRQKQYGESLDRLEGLLGEQGKRSLIELTTQSATPRLLQAASQLYRLANEKQKPNEKRKPGYQERDLPLIKSGLSEIEKNYDGKVDSALVKHFQPQFHALPEDKRNAALDKALSKEEIDKLYSGTKLNVTAERLKWLDKKPEDFKKSDDTFIKLAVALYDDDLKKEAEKDTLVGDIQEAYSRYMAAKIAFMQDQKKAIFPDANSTLRVTFGSVKGRDPGADGTTWKPFTTVEGVLAKATGEGEFNAPQNELDAIRAKNFGSYVDKTLGTVPVDFLATLDITGGNSGSPALNSKAELVGLAFDGTLDSIISDWDYNPKMVRTILLDARYMLWQIEKVDKVSNLLEELGFTKSAS